MILQEEFNIITNKEFNLITNKIIQNQANDVLFESDLYPEYSPLKEYISKIRCVICQKTDGKDIAGEPVEPDVDYVPEMVNISDPAHIKTVGSGGPDTENIVPLCHFHHQELHNVGIITFQVEYNVNLKNVAIEIFRQYSSSISESDYAEKAAVQHNRMLTKVHEIRSNIVDLGEMLIDFRDTKVNGKPMYEWLGFASFPQYITAPPRSGGLGLSGKTMYRWIRSAELKRELPECPVEELGAAKADLLLTAIQATNSDVDKKKMFDMAMAMSIQDVAAMVRKKMGRPDQREELHVKVIKLLSDFFNTVNATVDPHYVEAFAWQIMKEFGR